MTDNRGIFIRGDVVNLRALSREDVVESGWYGWFNDEEVCRTLQKHYFPNTVDEQMQYFEDSILGSRERLQVGICCHDEDKLVGIVSLSAIDFLNRKCEFSIVIGEREGRNVKIFLEAARLIFRHAFDTLNMNKVYGGSISKELVNLMCRSLGCREEGVLRQDIYKHGKYNDCYRYSILKDEYVFRK